MFKIIALVTALSGQPVDVLMSNVTHPNCPNAEALHNISVELQGQLDPKHEKYKIEDAMCVPADDAMSAAKKLLTQKGA